MNEIGKYLLVLGCLLLAVWCMQAQERDFSGAELALDQDHYADFFSSGAKTSRNYSIGFRVTMFGYETDNDRLGLPYIRRQLDEFLVKPYLRSISFRHETELHDISFIANGFTPQHISDETELFSLVNGSSYSLDADRPFSSFTGFRSTKRFEGNKLFSTSAKKVDFAVISTFSFGFAGFGIANALQNFFHGNDAFGTERPQPTLWKKDDAKAYPTGQVFSWGFPLMLYTLSAEAVVWKPIKTFQFQLRPEFNLGYYTNFGFGFDLGKVMRGEKFIDNLGYTDTNNASILSVARGYFAYSLVAGGTARFVLYNAHLNGLYSLSRGHYIDFENTRHLVLEGYAGAKIQIMNIAEFMISVTTRTPEIKSTNEQELHYWATMSAKFILNSYN